MNTLITPGSGNISFSRLVPKGSDYLPPLSSSARIAYTRDGGLTIVSTASSSERFNVEGNFGNLLTVNDAQSGTLFSINDISGFPLLIVSDNGALSTNSVIFASGGNSDQWNSVYTQVKASSSAWDDLSDLSEVAAASASWNSVYTSSKTNSSSWDSTYTSVKITSANWDSVYTSNKNNSANWDSNYTFTKNNSASWDSTYSSTKTNSASWNSVYTSVTTNSSTWDDLSDLSEVAAASASWNSVYTTTKANSSLWGGEAPVVSVSGSNIPLGIPFDGSLSAIGDTAHGFYLGWSPYHKVTDAIDDLNEIIENVRRGTTIKSVAFNPSTRAIGQNDSITLTISITGNTLGNGVLPATNTYLYTINWDDDDWDSYTTTSAPYTTPSHTYTAQGTKTIAVTARNTSGGGTGSFADVIREDILRVYGPDPVAQFNLYRNQSTGGTALAGNELWVKTNDTLYLENTSTNCIVSLPDPDPTYIIQWNTGDNSNIPDNSTAGGVGAARASKTGYSSSGTSTYPVKLTIQTHPLANPAVIPEESSVTNLKVYSLAPTLPTALNARFIAFSTTNNKLLAYGFTDNILGGASTTPGSNINRYTAGTAETSVTSPISYVADSSTVTALVNGTGNGNRTIVYSATTANNGTFTSLVLSNFTDYGGATKYDSSGNATTFAASIYYPQGFYGTQAKISKSIASISVGVNSYQLDYNNGSSNLTNEIEFVKDDLTVAPTINVGSTTVTQNTQGTLRYVSGVPYYNTGGIVDVAGITFSNWIGQTYQNTSTPVIFSSDTALEGSGSLFSGSQQTKTYANLDGSTTYLNGGIPIAGTGQSTPYSIGTQTLNINATSTAVAAQIKLSLQNVNGTTNSSAITNKTIQLHSATPTFNEEAITCTVAGNSTAAKRIDTGWAGSNPVYNSATNYFSNNAWSGAVTVAGTDEAIVRYNVLKHFTTDLSTGYLPAGPNLNTGRSGNQYFRFAFTRSAAQNFTFAITAPGGIAGLWIAAPGTAIDTSSTLNGWIDGSVNYAGTGVPGAGTGGNGSNGCASGTPIPLNTALAGSYTLTLGTENLSNATNNQLLVTIALASGDTITSLSIS